MADEPKKKGAEMADGGKKRRQKSPKPELENEKEPVISGRLVLALAILAVMLFIPQQRNIVQAITKTAPRTTARANWKVGQTANLHLTVVTADYAQMACADDRSVGGAHCEYENERERWPKEDGAPVDDNKAKTLQPYRTTDKNLLLVAGLWAQPEVAMRVHNEPSQGISAKKLARFVVDCEVRFLEEWKNAQVRWKPSERWSDQGTAMVGEIVSCSILEEEGHES